jgi:benzodiazapine receptor
MNKWLRIASCVIICQMAGVIGSIFTMQAIPSWYSTLEKPWFTPPNWVFGPVWITLFTLMGISLYWVSQRGKEAKVPLAIFAAQLAVNTLWNVLFFGIRNPLYGLIGIIVLWALIAATIVTFYRTSKKAGLILLPYIIWVSIATLLNYYVWVLNP